MKTARQAYHIEMDDGKLEWIQSDCAANAISDALIRNLGHRVVKCWAGGAKNPKYPDHYGRIDYDVPAHVPLTEKPKLRQHLRPKKFSNELGLDIENTSIT